jgi:5'-nucleotidase
VTAHRRSWVRASPGPPTSLLHDESDPAAATCDGKVGRITINGTLVNPTDAFRVTMNNVLATGGDGFTVFNEGTDALGGAQDIDSFAAYLAAAGPAGVAVPALDRVTPIP